MSHVWTRSYTQDEDETVIIYDDYVVIAVHENIQQDSFRSRRFELKDESDVEEFELFLMDNHWFLANMRGPKTWTREE